MKFTRLPSGRRLAIWGALLALVCIAAPRLDRENFFSEGGRLVKPKVLPEFPVNDAAWIGTEPMTAAEMQGRVWVLKVWTFGCINCLRSIPYFNELSERFEGRVGVLGIHSPEFDWERNMDQFEATMDKHGVRFPSFIDSSLDYFFALEAPGWPAFYVIDRRGMMRGLWVGEMHAGTVRARQMEKLIGELLAE